VHRKVSSLWGRKKVVLRQTPRAVTPFGGLSVFIDFLRRIGFSEQVRRDRPVHLKSPKAIPAEETFTAFVISGVAGARRFAHSSMLRADRALQALQGMKRFPTDGTIRNLFKRFRQGRVVGMYEPLWAWQLERLPLRSEGYSLNLDSTVFERYGRQEGAQKGYNPKKPGRASHPPLLAVVGGSALCAARLAAQGEHAGRQWGGRVSERGAGQAAQPGMGSNGAGRCRIFRSDPARLPGSVNGNLKFPKSGA